MAERCARMFPSGIDGTLPPHQCKSRGSVEHEGKWYCKIHARPFAKLGEIERLQALNAELLAVLRECEEYFDQRADAEYLPGQPAPKGNEEMYLLCVARAAIARAESQQ